MSLFPATRCSRRLAEKWIQVVPHKHAQLQGTFHLLKCQGGWAACLLQKQRGYARRMRSGRARSKKIREIISLVVIAKEGVIATVRRCDVRFLADLRFG